MKNFSTDWVVPALMAPSLLGLMALVSLSCSKEDSGSSPGPQAFLAAPAASVTPERVARLLSEAPLGIGQVREVRDAVDASSSNGYDEEYTFGNMLAAPGAGVGDALPGTRASREYPVPLRSLLRASATRSGDCPPDFLDALAASGLQIYWPYSEDWDGETLPVVTFDPGDGSLSNVGFERVLLDDGSWSVREIEVDESVAMSRPVWVVNRNEDEGFLTPQMLEKLPGKPREPSTRSSSGELRTLTLKTFRADRNYDSWFAGASEFWVKCGAVEHFVASSEYEMRQYSPSVTDFMIVVRRKKVGKNLPFNVVLVSEWTSQLENCAFLIVEDDGGARTSWKCSAEVKIKSKTYGFDVNLPFRRNDDIVWRGRLSHLFLEKYNNRTARFGDVNLTFSIASL